MAQPQPTLNSLAATISETAKAISTYIEQHGLPQPSFAEDGPVSYPTAPEVQGARFQLIGALLDLLNLAYGPADMSFINVVLNNHDGMVLDVLSQLDFFTAVPLNGSVTYTELAKKTNVAEPVVRRLLRHAITSHFFAPAPGDSVAHTANSAQVARTPLLKSWLAHNFQEIRPALTYQAEALRRAGPAGSEEITESAFAFADLDRKGRPVTYWDYINDAPKGEPEGFRAKRFAEAMRAASLSSIVSREDVIKQGLDWAALGEATVVDIGGSSGHDAVVLAQNYPNLRLIVQDLPEVRAAFHNAVPSDLTERITFEAHDFFTPENTDADVYFLKMILHDWPDKYAVRILQNVVPRLKPSGRVVLCEVVAPATHDEDGNETLPLALQRFLSAADLQMQVLFNSMERSLKDWESLVSRADERLEVARVSTLPGALWSCLEIKLKA